MTSGFFCVYVRMDRILWQYPYTCIQDRQRPIPECYKLVLSVQI